MTNQPLDKQQTITEIKKESWYSFLRKAPFNIRAGLLITMTGTVLLTSLISYEAGSKKSQSKNDYSTSELIPMSLTNDQNPLSYQSTNNNEEIIPDNQGESSLTMKQEGDTWQFSSDGGNTWSDKVPENVEVGEDGTITWGDKEGIDSDALTPSKIDPFSDTLRDSRDLVEDWSTVRVAEGVLMKLKDDKLVYSTDEGKTWTEDIPKELTDKVNSVIANEQEGKMTYSTDGGKTWSEEKPEGFDFWELLPETEKTNTKTKSI